MNEVTRARMQLFAVLLIIIIAAHILLIKLFVFNHHPETEPAPEAVAAAPARTAEAKTEAAEKPGFWSRLFGSSRKTAAKPVAKAP